MPSQYAHNAISTLIRRRPNVLDVVKASKQRYVRSTKFSYLNLLSIN